MTEAVERQPLTARQQDVLTWISGYIDTHGFSPTIRQIGHAFGWTVNGVACHLRPMKKKGWITWIEGEARTLRVIGGDA
jgi:SOS-response transcriptional repressor LexA